MILKSALKKFDMALKRGVAPSNLFVSNSRKSLEERFRIYAEGYGLRSQEAMQEVYPHFRRLVGKRKWNSLGAAYISDFRSRDPNLSNLGCFFSLFLKRIRAPKAYVELANVEWVMNESFHSSHMKRPLSLEAFKKIHEDSRFVFSQATRLMKCSHGCAGFISSLKARSIKRRKEYLVIYRQGFLVFVDSVSLSEYRVLEALRSGATLGAALERQNIDTSHLSHWLKRWCDHEYFQEIA